ncbi:putative RTA1 domain protein [Dendryphion nanum]|uniref:RTA1 domain protein n=1 Tax=Dendryphion nanum TaxID=256645 RepID=A0A9P9IGN2_9PLEO|nr:putative RTA1 domain protein [Dendryphion nanum]
MAEGNRNNYYDWYLPSIAAAAIFIGIFTFLTLIHAWRLAATRTWFCIPFIIGGLLEIGGYAGRLQGYSKPDNFTAFLIQAIFVLLAPLFYVASIYMFLGRIMLSTCPPSTTVKYSHAIVRPTRLTKIFVGGDILCFGIQGAGGAIMAGSSTKSTVDLGNAIILAGLALQVVIFCFFVLVAVVWNRRVKNVETAGGNVRNAWGKKGWGWERYLQMLYIVSGLVMFRNLFRLVEYAMGDDGYLMKQDWPIYIFDAVPMAFVLVLTPYWYVGDITNGIAKKRKNESTDEFLMMVDDTEQGRGSSNRR